MRRDLEREHGIAVSLRTVERAVEPLCRELRADDPQIEITDQVVAGEDDAFARPPPTSSGVASQC